MRSERVECMNALIRSVRCGLVVLSLGFTLSSHAATNSPAIALARDAQGFNFLSWPAQTNAVFTLQSRADFFTGAWTNFNSSNALVTVTSNSFTVKDTRPVAGERQFYQLRSDAPSRFGVFASYGRNPGTISNALDLGAAWVRLNCDLDGNDPDFKSFLDAGFNLIITCSHRDTTNCATTYGTLAEWPNAGFPYKSRAAFQARITAMLAPVLPYLALGRQVWVQCENEIGDAALIPTARFFRGTTGEYVTNLTAFSEAVRSVSVSLVVALTSFASENLDAVTTPTDPNYVYQTNRMTLLLSSTNYDAADLHFYGCVSDIAAKAQWVKDRLPAGRRWISTENGGPDYRCPTTPLQYSNNPALFESIMAQQVPARLNAAATNGATVSLWFSLFDPQGEADTFNHLGLLDQSVVPVRKKPAYDAFKAYTSTNR